MCLLEITHNFLLLQVNNTTYTYSPTQKVLEPNFVVGAPSSARLPEAGSQLNYVVLPGNITMEKYHRSIIISCSLVLIHHGKRAFSALFGPLIINLFFFAMRNCSLLYLLVLIEQDLSITRSFLWRHSYLAQSVQCYTQLACDFSLPGH